VSYRALTQSEIDQLVARGCSAEGDKWSAVLVDDGFVPDQVRNVGFHGGVRIGANARIENVGILRANPGATFGNGVEVEVLNEGGGRELVLFSELSSQFAYLMCMFRDRPKLIEKLSSFIRVEPADYCTIGAGTTVRNVAQIIDVNIGDHAIVQGAASLVNGTILSSEDAPTTVGTSVDAEDFIIAEGSQVTGAAIISKTYIGQGCRIGKQFSAESCVFFANCEGFHGEACSIFAGPYTVTHHKSTLLIAGLFSFYNAGSGTNQSNHMYKLGPVHEGKIERGSKTGSFSYMMWPCRVGPFSVVLGKHKRNFDTADFPFSVLDASSDGKCEMVPGLNLSTVGTVRDGAKWPTRDRRKGSVKRDRISFDVLSPYTVGRMIRGSARLKVIQDATARSVETVTISGAQVKRVLLRTGQKFYRSGIQMYLLEKVVERLEAGEALSGAKDIGDWVDIGGQLMPQTRLDHLCTCVESGEIADMSALNAVLDNIHTVYDEDQWPWVAHAYQQVFGDVLENLSAEQLAKLVDAYQQAKTKFLKLILVDANKEFDDASRIGFDGEFDAVRGTSEDNKFVKQLQDEIAALQQRVSKLKDELAQRA
jgi:hypothetical protein